jgi:hypothetical protein
MKTNDKRRSCNYCNGSPRACSALCKFAKTYLSFIEQSISRLFVALTAIMDYNIYGGDAIDAYACSPPPPLPTFVCIDDAYYEWCLKRFRKKLDRQIVLPVLCALQGHPGSDRLWEKHVNRILADPELGFKPATHERNIYVATVKGTPVLLSHQVNDFIHACSNAELAEYIYCQVGMNLQLPIKKAIPFRYYGCY